MLLSYAGVPDPWSVGPLSLPAASQACCMSAARGLHLPAIWCSLHGPNCSALGLCPAPFLLSLTTFPGYLPHLCPWPHVVTDDTTLLSPGLGIPSFLDTLST